MRIGVIHNPTSLPKEGEDDSHFLSRAIQAAMNTLEPAMARSFVTKLLKEENVEALQKGEKTLDDLSVHVSFLTAILLN